MDQVETLNHIFSCPQCCGRTGGFCAEGLRLMEEAGVLVTHQDPKVN